MEIHKTGQVITLENVIDYLEEFNYKADCLEKSFNKIFDYKIDEVDLLKENGLVDLAIMIINGIKDKTLFEEVMEEIEADNYQKTRWDLEDEIEMLEYKLEKKEKEIEEFWDMYREEMRENLR